MVLFLKPYVDCSGPEHRCVGYTLLGFTMPTWYDPRIALGVLPILVTMLMVVPDMLTPIIYSMSVEDLVDMGARKLVLQEQKLANFAVAAKLLQSMRSKTRAANNRKEAAKGGGAKLPSVTDYLASLPKEKQKRAHELQEVFAAFDSTGEADGSLQLGELGALMASLGSNLEEAELKQLVEELDVNSDGEVSFVEFAMHMFSDAEEEPAEEVAVAIFDMVDSDRSGSVTLKELQAAFAALNSGLTDDDTTEIMSRMDTDGSGSVDKPEFVKLLTSILEEYAAA